MRVAFLIIVYAFGVCGLHASDQQSYSQGKSHAQGEMHIPDHAVLSSLPGSDGNCSQKEYFNNPAGMTNDASALLVGGDEKSTNMAKQVSGTLQEAANQRPMFLLDENDPYIKAGDYIVNHALDEVKAKETYRPTSLGVKKIQHKCEESREPTYHTCMQTKQIQFEEPRLKVHRILVHACIRSWFFAFPLHWYDGCYCNVITGEKSDGSFLYKFSIESSLPQEYWNRVKSVKLVNPVGCFSLSNEGVLQFHRKELNTTPLYGVYNITAHIDVCYRPFMSASDIRVTIEDRCISMENQSDKGLCAYVDEKILEGPGTRNIKGFNVYQDWWKKQRTYKCSYLSKNNCGELRRRGCSQISSDCKTKLQNTCVEYVQTFECEEHRETSQGSSLSGPVPFCLDSTCDDHSWAPNQDFAEAMSRLAIFKEMQKTMAGDPLMIFSGKAYGCRKNCLSFRDCCGSGKGWGKSFGYSCNGEEKQLALQRDDRKCVFIGTFCKEKQLGVCIKKVSTYCCFGSKLIRIVQEQARGQLGIGWGSSECPNCRGLTVDEISRVDFSKLDLTEVFEDIMAKTQKPDLNKFATELKHNSAQKIQALKKRIQPGQRQEDGHVEVM